MAIGCFPWVDPYSFGGQKDAFVVRMSSDLTAVDNATYLGGDGLDFGTAIAVNKSMHKVYVTGGTSPAYIASPPTYYNNFPERSGHPNGFQTTYGGNQDAFVARFSYDLALEKSTYFGGTYFERGADIVLDTPGEPGSDVFISGWTESNNLPGTDKRRQPQERQRL